MELSILAVVVIWFITGFVINHLFESERDELSKHRFHLVNALQLIIHIIAIIAILGILFG